MIVSAAIDSFREISIVFCLGIVTAFDRRIASGLQIVFGLPIFFGRRISFGLLIVFGLPIVSGRPIAFDLLIASGRPIAFCRIGSIWILTG